MVTLTSLGHLLVGALIGATVGLAVAIMIPGPQPWLILGGLALGGFAAMQRRKRT